MSRDELRVVIINILLLLFYFRACNMIIYQTEMFVVQSGSLKSNLGAEKDKFSKPVEIDI